MSSYSQSEKDKYLKELQHRDHEINRLNGRVEYLTKELEKCSQTDPLTGVYNRLVFETVLRKEWERCKRHAIPISLIITDIDFFKEYNEVYGYQEGDECIIKIASSLTNCARRSSDTVCRFGGDKFVIIVPHLMKTNAFELASHIKNNIFALNIPHAGSPDSAEVTVSIGVHTVIPEDELSMHDFVRVTEIALFEAKQEGNSIVVE